MGMEKIAVIGAGLVGRSWSIVFARAGVKWPSSMPTRHQRPRALAAIEQSLCALQSRGTC